MNREPTLEQKARFERLCFAPTDDIQANAYRAAIKAGYTLRMAKSKSYKLAWNGPSLGSDDELRGKALGRTREKARGIVGAFPGAVGNPVGKIRLLFWTTPENDALPWPERKLKRA